MAGEQRTLIKFIRDGVKANYIYKDNCEICDTGDNLELHHYHTIFFLVEKFKEEYGNISDQEDFRAKFIERYWEELVNLTATLCEKHHTQLHKVYGSKPELFTASKQINWVRIQYEKEHKISSTGGLSRFKVKTNGIL